jgi:lysophospholipase L1-like esterase
MRILCLGDSYTIGEQVETENNFPNQLVHALRKSGYEFDQPLIIAKTGWTTDELQKAINEAEIEGPFDFVTLLIGVNNQYRGRTVEDYQPQFEDLLIQSLRFAGDNQRNVIVISIPDWGVTPFASLPKDDGSNHNVQKVADEIDAYNVVNKSVSERYGVHYVEITESTRRGKFDRELVAIDGLHPSAKEYSVWAEKIFSIIKTELSRQ